MRLSLRSAADAETVRDAARQGDPDRYLAALLAPKDFRDDLVVLAAVTGEVNRIMRVAHDPHLAEIRLQWWRDALLSPDGAATGNPVADAFINVMQRRSLPHEDIAAWFDARAHTFYAAPPGDDAQLELEMRLVEGTAFSLAARILDPVDDMQGMQSFITNASVAYGLARIGADFPYWMARGRFALPATAGRFENADARAVVAYISSTARRALAAARAQWPRLPPRVIPAFLPLALVEPYLRALERHGHDVLHQPGEIAPLRRVARLWLAHVTRKI